MNITYITLLFNNDELTKNSFLDVLSPLGIGWKTAKHKQVPTMAVKTKPWRTNYKYFCFKKYQSWIFKNEYSHCHYQSSHLKLLSALSAQLPKIDFATANDEISCTSGCGSYCTVFLKIQLSFITEMKVLLKYIINKNKDN